jgi:hypothetical protein
LEQELAASRTVRSRIITIAALIPDILLGALSSVGGSGGFLPLPNSVGPCDACADG